jgi:hypothetical protein
MRKTSIAFVERLLRFWTTKARASAIIGDLVEVAPQKGTAWFWSSILKIGISVSWRPLLGLVAASYVGLRALSLQMLIYGVHAHHPPYSWVRFFGVLDGAANVLLLVLPYAAIRYGARDRITALAAGWTGLLILFLCEWWRPGVPAMCIALGVGIIVFSSCKSELRKPSVSLLATVAVGIVAGVAVAGVTTFWEYLVQPALWGDAALRAHPSADWVFGLAYLAAVCATTAILSRLRSWSSRTVSE